MASKNPNSQWYTKLFDESYYLVDSQLHQKNAQEVQFLKNIIGQPEQKKVLDLCCGYGRHLVPLRKDGYDATGVDLSKTLLDKIERGNDFTKQADMRSLPFADHNFDAVYMMYTSFGYFDDPADDDKVLREVSRVLAPKGLFILDIGNYQRMKDSFNSSVDKTLPNGTRLHEKSIFDAATSRVHSTRSITIGDKKQVYTFSVRAYKKEKLVDMLNSHSMGLIHKYGNYGGKLYTPQSPRLILVAQKKNK